MNDRQDILRSAEAALATVNRFQLRQAASLAEAIDGMRLRQVQSLAEVVRSIDQRSLRQAESLVDSFNNLRLRQIQSLAEVAKSFEQDMLLQTEAMVRLMERAITPFNIEFSDMEIYENSAVLMSGEVVETSEYNRKILEISESTSDFYEFIDKVSYWISGLPTDKIRKVACFLVFSIFVPYMVSIFAGQTAHMHPSYLTDADYRSTKKEIIQNIREENTSEKLKNHRVIVAKRGLYVRSISSNKGDVIGGLPFGSIVLFLEKTKSWSFVEYENEDGDTLKGWVYSRYLNKF